MLTYCQFRGVSEDGKVSCRKIVRGDNEVSLAICEGCPAARCNCGHLRFSLQKEGESAIVIRYGNGRVETLDSGPVGVGFAKAACAAQMRTVDTESDCRGCPLRSNGFAREVIPPVQVEAVPPRAKVIPFAKAVKLQPAP